MFALAGDARPETPKHQTKIGTALAIAVFIIWHLVKQRCHSNDKITTQSRRLHELAIHRYLEDTAFGPEDVKVITTAFRAALEALSVADDNCPMAELIAKNIVEVARRGERDPILLREKALGPTRAFEPTRSGI